MQDIPVSQHNADSAEGPDPVAGLRRLAALVAQARRQEQIEQRVWNLTRTLALWLVPGLLLAWLLAWLLASLLLPALDAMVADLVRALAPKQVFVLPLPFAAERDAARGAYRNGVVARLEAAGADDVWSAARSSGLSGSVLVSLRIARDGSLARAFFQSSGDGRLDQAACRIAMRAAPYAPFPAQMQELTVIRMTRWVTFNYAGAPIETLYPGVPPRALDANWLAC